MTRLETDLCRSMTRVETAAENDDGPPNTSDSGESIDEARVARSPRLLLLSHPAAVRHRRCRPGEAESQPDRVGALHEEGRQLPPGRHSASLRPLFARLLRAFYSDLSPDTAKEDVTPVPWAAFESPAGPGPKCPRVKANHLYTI